MKNRKRRLTRSLLALFCGTCLITGCDGLNLDNQDPEGKEGDGIVSDSPKSDNEMSCEVTVAESFPMQVTRVCVIEDHSGSTLKLVLAYDPVDGETFTVLVAGEAFTDFTFDESQNAIILSNLDDQPASFEVEIRFSSEQEFDHDGSEGGTVQGVVKDASNLDGCQWFIQVDNGDLLNPINLESSLQVDGTALSFKWEPPSTNIASACMSGTLAVLTDVKDISDSYANHDDSTNTVNCDDARGVLEGTIDMIEEDSGACTTDDDCMILNGDPTAACPMPSYVTKSAYENFQVKYSNEIQGVRNICPMPEMVCGAAYPSNAVCNNNVCTGSF